MARNTYGLDLGSYEIKVYDKNKDTIWKEKSAIAFKDRMDIIAIGDDAYEMNERTPSDIQVVFPMTHGVISQFNDMQFLVQGLLKKGRTLARGAEYVIAVPTDITEVEKKAFFDLVVHSNARGSEINIVERAIADAIGMNLDVKNTKGAMIVNIGGETTELSVLAGGGLVMNKLLNIGGKTFDQSLINQIHNTQDFRIGSHTAERLRKNFGIFTSDVEETQLTGGIDLITGLPSQKQISISSVREAMQAPLQEVVDVIAALLDRTPPEVRIAIEANGIFLSGGVANTEGLETYIEHETGIRTRTAIQPNVCAVKGIQKIIASDELSKLAYSMIEENYRWMR